MTKKAKKEYTLDELGELIVPHKLTDAEAKEISDFIKAYKEKNRINPQARNRRKVKL